MRIPTQLLLTRKFCIPTWWAVRFWASFWTLWIRFIFFDEMAITAGFCNDIPVNGIYITQMRIFFNTHRTTQNRRQTHEPDVLYGTHFINDQGVVMEQYITAYDCQVRKQLGKWLKPLYPVQKKVTRNFAQLGKSHIFEVLFLSLVDQENLNRAFHHRTVLQSAERRHRIPDVQVRTHWKREENEN